MSGDFLLFTEGHAISALIHGRICFMGSNKDSVQRAIIRLITMVCTLSYGTLNALISVTVHINSSFLFDMLIMSEIKQSIR